MREFARLSRWPCKHSSPKRHSSRRSSLTFILLKTMLYVTDSRLSPRWMSSLSTRSLISTSKTSTLISRSSHQLAATHCNYQRLTCWQTSRRKMRSSRIQCNELWSFNRDARRSSVLVHLSLKHLPLRKVKAILIRSTQSASNSSIHSNPSHKDGFRSQFKLKKSRRLLAF